MSERIGAFANWLNNNVVGSPWTLAVAILLVTGADLMIPFQGFSRWNLTTGLFFNTQSSNIELITGIAAVVAVVSVHRGQKEHRKEIKDLHGKIDILIEANQAPDDIKSAIRTPSEMEAS